VLQHEALALVQSHLVGGFNPSEKYLSVGMIIPNIWRNKNMFQTTNQSLSCRVSCGKSHMQNQDGMFRS
jgi:hypothetical protein